MRSVVLKRMAFHISGNKKLYGWERPEWQGSNSNLDPSISTGWWYLDAEFSIRALLLQQTLNLASYTALNALKSPMDAETWSGSTSVERFWQNLSTLNWCLVNLVSISALYWRRTQWHSYSDSKLEWHMLPENYFCAHTRGWHHLFFAFVTAEQFNL